MLLIAFALALLVIVAGMKLLIHTNKETLGSFYKYVSWFVIVMGFLMLLFIACSGLCRMCFKQERMMRMMEERHHPFYGGMGMGEGPGCCKMMNGCGGEGMMMGHGDCGGEMKEHCNKYEGGYEKCEGKAHHGGKGECDGEMEECPMKKHMECKKDSVKKKK